MVVPLTVKEGWFDFWILLEKTTFWACLLMLGLKLIFRWKAQLFIFSKSAVKLIPDWFIPCRTEKSEASSANSSGLELKLSDKSFRKEVVQGSRLEEPLQKISNHLECCPFNTTVYFLFFRRLIKIFNTFLDLGQYLGNTLSAHVQIYLKSTL